MRITIFTSASLPPERSSSPEEYLQENDLPEVRTQSRLRTTLEEISVSELNSSSLKPGFFFNSLLRAVIGNSVPGKVTLGLKVILHNWVKLSQDRKHKRNTNRWSKLNKIH